MVPSRIKCSWIWHGFPQTQGFITSAKNTEFETLRPSLIYSIQNVASPKNTRYSDR